MPSVSRLGCPVTMLFSIYQAQSPRSKELGKALVHSCSVCFIAPYLSVKPVVSYLMYKQASVAGFTSSVQCYHGVLHTILRISRYDLRIAIHTYCFRKGLYDLTDIVGRILPACRMWVPVQWQHILFHSSSWCLS